MTSIAAAKPSDPRIAFGVLALVQSTLIFTIALITVPLPAVARELDATAAELLLVLAAYGLPFSGLLLFGGRLADRYGGRRMLAHGLLVFGLASLSAAAAPTLEILIAMRFAQGVGGAMIAPAAMAVLRALYPDAARFGRAMATWGGVSVLGAVVGFMASGVMTTWVSWRWMFAVPVLVAVIGLLAARGLLPAGRTDDPAQRPALDRRGALLATSGISLSSFGLIATGDHGWSSPAVLGPLVGGIALLVAFFRVERRVADPLLPPGFVFRGRRTMGVLGMFLAAAGSGVVNFVLSLYLQQVGGFSPLATALAFLPFALALVAVGRVAPQLVGRLGAGGTTRAGLVIAALGLALLARLGAATHYWSELAPGVVLLAMGMGMVFAGSAVLATEGVAQNQAGLAGGVMNTAMELGPTVGLATLMAIAATRSTAVEGYSWAFGTAAAAYLLTALLEFIVSRRRRRGH